MFQKIKTAHTVKKTALARIALLGLGAIWGSTFVVVSSTSEFFQPAFLIALRFSISFVFLAVLFFPRFKLIQKEYVVAAVLAGITSFFGYYTQAYAMTTLGGKPGRTAFLVATYCVIVPFASWLINKKRPDKYNIIAAFMCIAGVALISLPDLLAEGNSSVSLADFFALASSFIFVANIIIVERMISKLDTVLFTILHFFVVSVLAVAFTALFEDNSHTLWSGQSLFTLFYLAIPCTALALLLQSFGQKYTPASTAALFFSLESVFGIAFSVLAGVELLSTNLLIGGMLIVLSIVISESKLQFLK